MGGTSKQFIFLVVLGLRCCSKAFGERGLSFAAVHRLLTAMAAPATECRLQAEGLSRCGAQAVAAPRQMESSQTRDRAHVPCMGRWTLSHWTAREVPSLFLSLFYKIVCVFLSRK